MSLFCYGRSWYARTVTEYCPLRSTSYSPYLDPFPPHTLIQAAPCIIRSFISTFYMSPSDHWLPYMNTVQPFWGLMLQSWRPSHDNNQFSNVPQTDFFARSGLRPRRSGLHSRNAHALCCLLCSLAHRHIGWHISRGSIQSSRSSHVTLSLTPHDVLPILEIRGGLLDLTYHRTCTCIHLKLAFRTMKQIKKLDI